MEQFYLQDSRDYVGNDVLWWAKDGKGYTTDLRKAALYSQEAAQQMQDNRRSDVPWPKNYIDGKARPAVDMQYINIGEANDSAGAVPVERGVSPQAQKVADHIEQRLRTWRQRHMNTHGDHLELYDFMGEDSIADLVDYVCDEYALDALLRAATGGSDDD